ncbi:esterase family protein [Algoriphagus sp. H41]|uniref:Esterase family protein n=1 Tax=Algoriphagus oliviformis TaxID=2811231 RepID=A0ABS3C980_9BACT|nr:alpha/beta hydrolase-fold protein [Algoriphagus oliviformis]MBN7813360.1 esterase family protein [Algoriphagus oliviformis]
MKDFRSVEISDTAYERDGLRFLTLKSPNLQGRGDVCLFVPQVVEGLTGLPIYILLHGVYGSAWVWAMKGGAHTTAKRLMESGEIRPAIIAMPSDGLWGDGSGYLVHHGRDFSKWITQDVPQAIRQYIPCAGPNSKICLGGLSMGGYGALRLGLGQPESYSAISVHSAITRFEEMSLFVEERLDSYGRSGQSNDVVDLIKDRKVQWPPIRFDCGVDDELVAGNRLLHRQLCDLGIAHEYEEYAGGHEWSYWREHVEKSFRFFDIQLK